MEFGEFFQKNLNSISKILKNKRKIPSSKSSNFIDPFLFYLWNTRAEYQIFPSTTFLPVLPPLFFLYRVGCAKMIIITTRRPPLFYSLAFHLTHRFSYIEKDEKDCCIRGGVECRDP